MRICWTPDSTTLLPNSSFGSVSGLQKRRQLGIPGKLSVLVFADIRYGLCSPGADCCHFRHLLRKSIVTQY